MFAQMVSIKRQYECQKDCVERVIQYEIGIKYCILETVFVQILIHFLFNTHTLFAIEKKSLTSAVLNHFTAKFVIFSMHDTFGNHATLLRNRRAMACY